MAGWLPAPITMPANPMRLLSVIAFLALFAVISTARATPLPAPHQVDIPYRQRGAARPTLPAGRQWPVPLGDRPAWLRRAGRPLRAGAAALSRLGRAVVEGGRGGVTARQLWFARTRLAMPHPGEPGACPPRPGRGHHGVPAMAGGAALGRARPHQPAGLGEWRERGVVGGAPATLMAQPSNRISARRLHSIRTVVSPPASDGARGCRRWS